jgi:hypothetical protein
MTLPPIWEAETLTVRNSAPGDYSSIIEAREARITLAYPLDTYTH